MADDDGHARSNIGVVAVHCDNCSSKIEEIL